MNMLTSHNTIIISRNAAECLLLGISVSESRMSVTAKRCRLWASQSKRLLVDNIRHQGAEATHMNFDGTEKGHKENYHLDFRWQLYCMCSNLIKYFTKNLINKC